MARYPTWSSHLDGAASEEVFSDKRTLASDAHYARWLCLPMRPGLTHQIIGVIVFAVEAIACLLGHKGQTDNIHQAPRPVFTFGEEPISVSLNCFIPDRVNPTC
jgi:hypothetical protein